MKRLPLMLALAVSLAATTAQAQTTAEQAPAAGPAASEQTQVAASDAQTPVAAVEKKRLSDENCLRHTGSRITQRDGKPRCTGQPGRVYSKDDIDSTGHTNLADALRALDPALN